ncbi:MAG TPA: phage holin, LLH family [Nitrosomonas sp.]|nr:phage holin, LLH family [Nitrosomonas sp.]
MSIFSRVWHVIESFFEGVEREVVIFLDALAHNIARNGGSLLIQAAQQAVEAAEKTGGTGKEKFEAAQKEVKEVLEASGVNSVLSAINAAIEAAVAVHRELNPKS